MFEDLDTTSAALAPDGGSLGRATCKAADAPDAAAFMRHHVKQVRKYRNTPYVTIPRHVHLETFAICNAACDFCPYPTLERKGVKMPDAVIEKIIDDLTLIPRAVPFQLAPYKVSEPFLDKRLLDILERVNEKLPNAAISIFSNASPITEAALRRLAKVRRVCYLWLSINDYEAEPYERLMKIPFARTVDRLRMIDRLVAAGDFPHPVRVSRVADHSPRDEAFVRWVRQSFPALKPVLTPRKDWLGQVDANTTASQAPDAPCSRWFGLSITATGSAHMCCMDGTAEYTIGDAATEHVLAIYNRPDYLRIRQLAESRLQVSACRTCTYL